MSQQEEGEDGVSAEGRFSPGAARPPGRLRASRVHASPPQESEKLESVNAELKAQIEELKQQKQQLVYMLNLHRPTCIVRAQNGQTPEDERNLFVQHIQDSGLLLGGLADAGLPSLDHVRCSGHL